MGRVLPSFEVHRPNTTALDQKKSCFLSPSPQGAQLGGGSGSNARGHVKQPEIGDQSTSRALPHPYVSSGGCNHPLPSAPAPPATPLPLSFLPTSLDFSKTKCDTAHHPQTLLHTNPVRGKQPFLPCESWAAGQRQESSSTNRHIIITAAGPGQQPCCPEKWSPHPGQTAGKTCGWAGDRLGDPGITQPGTGVWEPQERFSLLLCSIQIILESAHSLSLS